MASLVGSTNAYLWPSHSEWKRLHHVSQLQTKSVLGAYIFQHGAGYLLIVDIYCSL